MDFYNKNCFRNYPIQQGCSCISDSGLPLPTSFIVAARLTAATSLLIGRQAYISQLTVNGSQLSITVSVIDGGGRPRALWFGSAVLTKDYQVIPMQFNVEAMEALGENTEQQQHAAGGGFIVAGLVDDIKSTQASFAFSVGATNLEPSTVVYIKPPGLTGVKVKGKTLRGIVRVDITNIGSLNLLTADGYDWRLRIIEPGLVESRVDKTSSRLTCNTPAIKQINSVPPNSAGNIDIFGIEPVTIQVTGFGIALRTTGFQLSDLCRPSNVPVSLEQNNYQGSILSAEQPEWKLLWPQYQDEE